MRCRVLVFPSSATEQSVRVQGGEESSLDAVIKSSALSSCSRQRSSPEVAPVQAVMLIAAPAAGVGPPRLAPVQPHGPPAVAGCSNA